MKKTLIFALDDNIIYIQLSQQTTLSLEEDNTDKQYINDIITMLQSILYKDICKYANQHNIDIITFNFFSKTHPISISVATNFQLNFSDMKGFQDYMMKKGYKILFKNNLQNENIMIKKIF